MAIYIGGIQQLAIGVKDCDATFHYLRGAFGTDALIADDSGPSPLMTQYTGGIVSERRAVIAMNLNGGGGFEFWQRLDRFPAEHQKMRLGDLGINIATIKSFDIQRSYEYHKMHAYEISKLLVDPMGKHHYYLTTPSGNLFDIIDYPFDKFLLLQIQRIKSLTGGVCGALIGCSDMDRTIAFYRDMLKYDQVLFDLTTTFDDLNVLKGGKKRFRRVRLAMSNPPQGPFSQILGRSQLDLIQDVEQPRGHRYQGREWGDPGYVNLAFDVQGIDEVLEKCNDLNYKITVDSFDTFQVGEAGGRVVVVEDPDGTWIEFVETHQIPLMQDPNLHLDLRKRDPAKPIPKFFLQGLRRSRVY